jgi:hypothetical protein
MVSVMHFVQSHGCNHHRVQYLLLEIAVEYGGACTIQKTHGNVVEQCQTFLIWGLEMHIFLNEKDKLVIALRDRE